MALKPMQPQPIDYFFTTISSFPLESILNFDSYAKLDAATLPLQLVNDCIAYQKNLLLGKTSTTREDVARKNYNIFSLDSLNLLKNQLSENKSINNRFVEKFIQSVHSIGQDMIDAYIKGDLEDLERRQYYYSGKRDYKKYLSMLHIALDLVPEHHQLSHILKIHNFYITGLIDRMQMATNLNTDSLLTLAFYNQQQALKLEPYAAYISNEIGNLYLYKKNYDSAKYNFDLASVISEKWAIPWSNKMRMNMVLNRFDEAEQDFKTADSLQLNLAYVFTNFGMVMEKKNNFLAAESYLRAIKENSVHYLPFEHLGYIYLKTANYDKANYYLHEAETRKKDFAIVPEAFTDGIVQGVIDYQDVEPNYTCPQKLIAKNETARQYIQLLNDLQESDSSNEKLIALQKLVKQKPDMPLASHYLGKKYYQLGEWQLARKALQQSVSNYLSDDELKKKLTLDINGTPLTSDFACELRPFLKYQYDVREDHYLLASLYEKSSENAKAFAQYKITSAIENGRQWDQATFSAFSKKYSDASPEVRENLVKQSEKFIFMAGSIKAARLHEKLGEYKEAEKILLHQVSLSRAAGNEYVKNGNPRYWLLINRYLELETYNFYKKVLNLYPRDPEWQENAGLFLYNRLAATFSQVPIDKQREFYEQMQWYIYPWQDDNLMGSKYNSLIPGTGENLVIIATKFDPVEESLDALSLSVKLTGDILPHIKAAKALADLNGWLGNEGQAIFWFKQSLSINPSDVAERNKYMYYLNQVDLMPDASKQLDTLYQQKKITRDQMIQLAEWKWLSGKIKQATALIKNFNPANEKEKRLALLLSSRMRMLSRDTKNALRILLDTSTISSGNVKDNDHAAKDKRMQNSSRLYSIARLYAILKNDDFAFINLKKALDSGFLNEFVLKYDNVWAAFRNGEKWRNLINKYNFDTDQLKEYINIDDYSVPHGLQ